MGRGENTLPSIDVLVVEDDSLLNKVMTLQLEHEGMTVRRAFNGEEALSLIKAMVPSIMILDVKLPIVDAFGVIEELRKSSKTSKIPLIIHTSQDLSSLDQSRLTLGPSKFVTKSTGYSDGFADLIRTLVLEI
jgi:DNA-binding response OmpR family regulator